MNTGAAIMVVGGVALWLWGIVTPGFSFGTASACVLGAFLIGLGAPRLFQ